MRVLKIFVVFNIVSMTLYIFGSGDSQINEANFITVYNFLQELKNVNYSMYEYVVKIQAIFCPNQPICGIEGEQDRSYVLETLPSTLDIINGTIQIEELPKFVGICCLPCSCSDSCLEDANCCLTKYYIPIEINESVPVKSSCVAASVKAYPPTYETSPTQSYYMINDCFDHEKNYSSLLKCRSPDWRNFEDTGPVTSLRTRCTYWNKHCAVCNSDADNILQWNLVVIFKRDIIYFGNVQTSWPSIKTFQDLYQRLIRFNDISYLPPFPMGDKRCFPKENQRICEKSLVNSSGFADWLLEACKQSYNPVYRQTPGKISPYLNIFCYFCLSNELFDREDSWRCDLDMDWKKWTKTMSALIDYENATEVHATTNHGINSYERHKCGCDEIYDVFQNVCRRSFCAVGEIMIGCRCVQFLKNLSGMPIMVTLEVAPNSDQSLPLVKQQILRLRTKLEKFLETTANHTEARIFYMFVHDNNDNWYYLFIFHVRTYPGYDTKLTVQPYMKYMDRRKRFEIKTGKMIYTGTMTSKVQLSRVLNQTTREVDTRIRLTDKPMDNFTELDFGEDKIPYYLAFQPLSHLLYCMQIELNETEFTEKEGYIIVNTTQPSFVIFDFYRISPARVRICGDHYLRKQNTSKTSSGRISSSVIVICGIILNLFSCVLLPQ